MTQGGTTSYSGVDLALGAEPSVNGDHLRPEPERAADELGVQPLVIVAVIAIASALGLALRRRFRISAAASALGWLALAVGVLVARSSLIEMVSDQADEPFPVGKSASDFVAIGPGFWLATVAIALGAGTGLVAGRRPDRDDGPTS